MAEQATDRAGKPISVGDAATVVGTVAAISGSGPSATITFTLYGSNTNVTVKAQDVAATAQTA